MGKDRSEDGNNWKSSTPQQTMKRGFHHISGLWWCGCTNTNDIRRQQNVTTYIQQYNKKFFIPHGYLLIDPIETDYAIVSFFFSSLSLLSDGGRWKKAEKRGNRNGEEEEKG